MKQVMAVSPNHQYCVLKDGDQYALISHKDGITKSTKWGGHSILTSALMKGNYIKVKPQDYDEDLNKSGRKSIARLDAPTKPKKDKNQDLIIQLGLENVQKDLVTTRKVKKSALYIDLQKADNSHLPDKAERFSYNCDRNYNIVYIPVNRLEQVYQTDKALNPKTVKRKMKDMKSGKPMPPVYIGYDYDVHDGHHSWKAAIEAGYTHVPCQVVGDDPQKVKEALARYKEVWKSLTPRDEEVLEKAFDLVFVVDLAKGPLNTARLVKRMVHVKGKNGKTFSRMQWVSPHQDMAGMKHPGVDHSTYHHHEEGLKEMEKRQSNRFPVMHHDVKSLRNRHPNYRTDKHAYAEAEKKYNKGEQLPPVMINPHGEIIDNAHLVDLAKEKGLSHVPVVVVGNHSLKKELEDKLRDKVTMVDEDGVVTDVTPHRNSQLSDVNKPISPKIASDLDHFRNFISKKHTPQYLMDEAKRQGIKWNELTKTGERHMNSMMWMRAYEAIVEHIKSGKTFEVQTNEKDINERMQRDGKDSIHKYFVKLVEKCGGKDATMEWCKKNGILWKESRDPNINWMNAVGEIKNRLAKGEMLHGIRTRQKGAMAEASVMVTDDIKRMVSELGKQYGKEAVMARADELGIKYAKAGKKGEPLSPTMLWARAHPEIARYVAKGNEFMMPDDVREDNGLVSDTQDTGGVELSKWSNYAVGLGKRTSQSREKKVKEWALKAMMTDFMKDLPSVEKAYESVMKKSRQAKVMMHFDPLEVLPNGSTLLDQMSSDGELKNRYALDNIDKEDYNLEVDEATMFGHDYRESDRESRPVYGNIDILNQGLKSNRVAGGMAFVLRDDAKKRMTGSAFDIANVPHGEEGEWVRSMDDPHQLLFDSFMSRWKNPGKQNKQRALMINSVISGKTYSHTNAESRVFETHLHGGLKLDRDVSHILMPSDWQSDKAHKEKHDKVAQFAKLFNIPIQYEEAE